MPFAVLNRDVIFAPRKILELFTLLKVVGGECRKLHIFWDLQGSVIKIQ